MEKRNVFLAVFAFIILFMLSMLIVGTTLAKYTVSVVAEDSVLTARFDVYAEDGNGNKLTYPSANRIDLFGNATTKANGTVAADTDGHLYIAPGVFGAFKIVINTLACDVDVETSESIISAYADGNLSVSEDDFFSYRIVYYRDTFDETDERSKPRVLVATDTTVINRRTLNDFCGDLEDCLDDLRIQKYTGGTLMVYWSWIDLETYDYYDTILGKKWAEPGYAPTVTLNIALRISQIVRTEGDGIAVTYTEDKVFTKQ
ncbi:MAG: hypothetical protein PHX51_06450 [Clostridia bacterium]|nr:hypothetical protein [Clostridia bacterium]